MQREGSTMGENRDSTEKDNFNNIFRNKRQILEANTECSRKRTLGE